MIFVSKTYVEKGVSYDYCIYANAVLLNLHPEIIPSRVIENYPKSEEF